MNTQIARRAFLGTAAAAGAGLVGRPLLASRMEGVHGVGTADVVGQELVAQLRLAVTGLQHAPGGLAARQTAGVLQIAAAHYRAEELDRTFRQHMRAQMHDEGRDAVLRRPIDLHRLAAEVATFGIRTPPRLGPPDPVRRGRVLEDVLSSGPIHYLEAGADTLMRIAGRLDRRPLGLVHVRYQDDEFQCPDLSGYVSVLEITMLGMCFWNPAACAIFSGMYAGLLIGLLVTGCTESA